MSLRTKILIIPSLIVIPLLWVLYLFTVSSQVNDFYPLYFAAQRVLAGQSPYGLQATLDLAQHWDNPFPIHEQTGVAYPLPLIFLIIPFSFLSFPVATFLWTTIGFLSSYLSVFVAQQRGALRQNPASYQPLSFLLPFTFYPLFRGIEIHQATLLWFGLAAILLLGVRRNHVTLSAICIVLLMLKPQNGLLFALYGLYWLFRNHRRGLLYTIALGGSLLGISLVVEPQWITEWLNQVEVYRSVVERPSLLPLGLVLLVITWRLKLWVKVAVAQVVLFPISDVYSTLPLLLAWCAFAPPVALLGTSISWLWVFLPAPMPLTMFWLLLFFPFMGAVLWEIRPPALRHAPIQSEPRALEPSFQGAAPLKIVDRVRNLLA